MDTKGYFGVISVNEQKYALPLKEIIGIESTDKVDTVEGKKFLNYQSQEVPIYDLILLNNENQVLRKLCVLLSSEPMKAIQVDAFNSKQLDKDKIQKLPEIMINNDSIIEDLLYDEDSDELLLMLTRESLIKYLDNRQNA